VSHENLIFHITIGSYCSCFADPLIVFTDFYLNITASQKLTPLRGVIVISLLVTQEESLEKNIIK
jgi:hypothetical protein